MDAWSTVSPAAPVVTRAASSPGGPRLRGHADFDANRYVVADLREQGGLIACRARDPRRAGAREVLRAILTRTAKALLQALIQGRVLSWFVRVTQIRDRMVELNQEITWTPAHIKDGHLRQVAGGRPRLARPPRKPLSGGAPIPSCGVARSGLSAHGRLRLHRELGGRLLA